MNTAHFSHHSGSSYEPVLPAARPDTVTDSDLERSLVRIDQLERALKAGEDEHSQMRRRIGRLERQLGVLMEARMEERGDLPTAQHGDHQALARRYRTLVEQNFVTFARRYASRCDRVLDRPHSEQAARLISLLSQQFFTNNVQQSPSIVRVLRLPENDGHIEAAITTLREHCTELASQIRRAGLRHAWDFNATSGLPADPRRQNVWAACDDRAPVSFVMSPAYLVNGRLYCPQYVFTTR